MTSTAIPEITVSGSIWQRGCSYGEAARERIKGTVDIYEGSLGEIGFKPSEVSRFIASLVDKVAGWAPELLEEIRGIAEGSGLTFDQIFFANSRSEVLQLARREKGLGDDEPDGCTGAVLLPEATRDQILIHGQNWDWRTESLDVAVILRVVRDDGPDLMTFTEAGGLARIGLNAAGIAITGLHLESDRDYRQFGIPTPFIRRRALDCQHYAHAIRAIGSTPKSCSNNMMLSTAAGDAINFECAPDESFAIYPQRGVIVHANHWQSAVALSKLKDTGYSGVPDSYYRERRVRSLLAERHGDLTVNDLKAAFRDDFAYPLSVCRPQIEKDAGNLTATVATIIMQPGIGLMEICHMPATNDVYHRYELSSQR